MIEGIVSGKIYLIPSALGDSSTQYFTEQTRQLIFTIEFFIAENVRSARRFLRSMGYLKSFDEVEMVAVEENKNFIPSEKILQHLKEGRSIGVLSEAGCPGIADPGSAVVRFGHRNQITVVPLIGPSSIFLALMASGLNGQQFAFHGYLPVGSADRKKRLRHLEEESLQKKQTQIFMETPYRNNALLIDILDVLRNSTFLCIASNITLPDESIFTQTVLKWKKNIAGLNKQPTIFLMLAE